MKKILILVALVCFGCQESYKDSGKELLRPENMDKNEIAVKWVAEYGTSPESVDRFNIALMRLVLEKHVQNIIELTKKIRNLEQRVIFLESLNAVIGE